MLRLPAPIRAAYATAVHGFKASRACPGRRRSDAGPATRARSMPRARCIRTRFAQVATKQKVP